MYSRIRNYYLPTLIGEQCRILYLPDNQNQVVLGVAGSGKSVEAVYRALWISVANPNEKVVVLSVNHDVNIALKRMIDSYTDSTNNIEVNTVYSYIHNIIKTHSNEYPENIKLNATTLEEENKIFNQLIEQSQNKYSNSTLWEKDNFETFIKEEIKWIQRNNIVKLDEYKNVLRIGRGSERISSQQRVTMFHIFEDFKKLRTLLTKKIFGYDDIYELVNDNLSIEESEKPKYIIVDEVQDLSPAMFNALSYVIKKDGYWSVFGDMSQNIFGQRISWKSLGLENIKKQYRLQKNYRNTEQIGKLAKSMLDTKLFQTDDSLFIEPVLSDIKGDLPVLWHCTSRQKLLQCIKENLNKGSIAIIMMNALSQKNTMIRFLKENNIEYTTYIDDALNKNIVFLSNINKIKGLEFDTVIVLGIDAIQSNMSENAKVGKPFTNDDIAIIGKTVYVATTRARKRLVLIYKNNPLDFLINDFSLVKKID